MNLDTTLTPSEFFFVPGRDSGLFYVEAPDWIMRRARSARVRQIAASDIPEVQEVIEHRLESRWQTPESNIVFEFNTVPVVLHDAGHRASFASTGGKWIANGAAGDRLVERFLGHRPPPSVERGVNRMFAEARAARLPPMPEWSRGIGALDVVIECRNQHNFYHFLTEALCQLSHFAGMRHAPNIAFQCRSSKVRAFPTRFVEALFPELAGRVTFVDRRLASPRVLAPYNHRHYLYQAFDPRTDAETSSAALQDEWWGRIGAHRLRRKFVFKNSYDTSLRLLRERALSILDPAQLSRLPRRIIVSRDPDYGARDRELQGADALVAALKPHGFVEVVFERMDPLQQIASIHAADIVIAEHGAALAHMAFARPDAHVVEIGTPQTQAFRWGDFLGNAHVAGCAYTTIFADISGDAPEIIHSVKDERHKGVRIGKRALDALVELVELADAG